VAVVIKHLVFVMLRQLPRRPGLLIGWYIAMI